MSWTDERVEILKTSRAAGLSASQIATKLGNITRNGVIGKIHRLGLSGGRSPHKRTTSHRTHVPRRKKSFTFGALIPHTPNGPGLPQPPTTVELGATFSVPDPPPEQRLSVMQIRDDTCKWPIGDPRSPGFGFCGSKPVVGGKIHYCEPHASMAFAPVPTRRRP